MNILSKYKTETHFNSNSSIVHFSMKSNLDFSRILAHYELENAQFEWELWPIKIVPHEGYTYKL